MKRLLLIAMVFAVASSASAHDHRPPRTYLWNDGHAIQRGLLGSYCWTQETHGHHSVVGCGDAVRRFPDSPAVVRTGERIAIRIAKSEKPLGSVLYAYATDRDLQTSGPFSEEIPYRLVRRGRAWHAVFTLDIPCRSYYLRFDGVWRDVDDGSDQDAYWTFHALTDAGPLADVGAPVCRTLDSI